MFKNNYKIKIQRSTIESIVRFIQFKLLKSIIQLIKIITIKVIM